MAARPLIPAMIVGNETSVDKRFSQLLPSYQGRHDGIAVRVGGFLEHDLNVQGHKDAGRARCSCCR
jgi:hypothetical protein